jgi:hypothetical protein
VRNRKSTHHAEEKVSERKEGKKREREGWREGL